MCLFLSKCSTADTDIKPQGHHLLYILWTYFPHFVGPGNVCSGCNYNGDFLINFPSGEKECVALKMVLAEAVTDAITAQSSAPMISRKFFIRLLAISN